MQVIATDTVIRTLTSRQLKAIAALLRLGCVSKAAESVGVNKCTIHRWMLEADFQRELSRQRQIMTQTALESVITHINSAVETLVDLLTCDSDAVRRGAARDILDLSLRLSDIQGLDQRLSEIEEIVSTKRRVK